MKNVFKLVVLLFVVAGFAAVAQAQQAKKVHRIGYLSLASAGAYRGHVDAFLQGLRELGYLEGKNIVIEQRYAAGRADRLPELAAELVRLKVDVMVVHGEAAVRAAREASATIPIVFAVLADPVGTGLVASLARPGGNVTGLSDFHGNLAPKRLELLKEVVPSVSRVAVLLERGSSSHRLQLKDLEATAPALRVTVVPLEVKGPDDFDRVFIAIRKDHSGAILLIGGPTISSHLRQIADFAVKSRLPAIYTIRLFVDMGGLMSYGANFDDLYRRAAIYVDKILKGTKPADLPVEQPIKFELVINLKAAKQIGLTIPPNVLARADKVIR